MLILTNGLYIGPREAQNGSILEVANKGLHKFDWSFPVYGDDFSHSYKVVL